MGYRIKTFGLFGLMAALFAAVGWAVGGIFADDWLVGALAFLGLAIIINLISYLYSKQIVLKAYRAKIVTPSEAPKLHRIVQGIAMKADMPMPELAIVPSNTPNAFATGRNPDDAVVAVTKGLLNLLDEKELEGVLAHEMAHVQNRDILVMSVAATLAGAIAFAARFAFYGTLFGGRDNAASLAIVMLAAITAPIAAMLVQMGISRSREYKADATGARMIGNPQALANALLKLESANQRRPMEGSPTNAHMFIVNPFRGGMAGLFSTHPPIEERVRKLEHLESRLGYY